MLKNKIEYAVVSATGKVRRNNEDNYCCCGKIREDVNDVSDSVCSGTVDAGANELFAVFDGMGGEACGEVASYIAASCSMLFTRAKDAYGEYLRELAAFINDKIREGTQARSLVLMGTTAAMLQAAGEDVYILNSGDSRIYKLSSHELRQISEDHILPVRGNAITQFLGMPEGYEPSPYVAKGRYKPGDMFLLCSDGVTDMLSDDEICRIIDDDRMGVDVLVRALADAALDKGGVDNTTALLLRCL